MAVAGDMDLYKLNTGSDEKLCDLLDALNTISIQRTILQKMPSLKV